MKQNRSFAILLSLVILGVGAALAYVRHRAGENLEALWIVAAAFIIALVVSSAIQVADQWDRAVILRLGHFHSLKGPGLFFIIPVVDAIPYWIDTRVITTGFKAEKTLTKDTVPVDVDAVLFWRVVDPKKAALDVADYRSAISWASQTALRDVIGKTVLSEMLEGRDKISSLLQKIIDERTEPWGINVISVEVKDVLIRPPTGYPWHGLQSRESGSFRMALTQIPSSARSVLIAMPVCSLELPCHRLRPSWSTREAFGQGTDARAAKGEMIDSRANSSPLKR